MKQCNLDFIILVDIFYNYNFLLQLIFFVARILFVDYGNEELVKCDTIKNLHPQFRHLPCQAIVCSLANIFPIDPSVAWTEDISLWFSNLLFGSILKITIISCTGPNTISVDAFLPISRITDSLLTNFDTLAVVEKLEMVSVTDFMCQAGLATQRKNCLVSQSTDSLQSESISVTSAQSQEIDQFQLLSLSDLPSLIIKLTESNEFLCLLSVISSNMTVYVHPVDVGVAHSITSLTSMLQDHYEAEVNRIPVPTTRLKNGVLCVVFSEEFEEWCRAVIVAVHSDLCTEDELNCLIFFIDYGGSVWETSSKLFLLCTPLSKFPATVICCHLGEEQGIPMINNEVLCSKMYSDKQELTSSEMFRSITSQIGSRPLVAVIQIQQGNITLWLSIYYFIIIIHLQSLTC